MNSQSIACHFAIASHFGNPKPCHDKAIKFLAELVFQIKILCSPNFSPQISASNQFPSSLLGNFSLSFEEKIVQLLLFLQILCVPHPNLISLEVFDRVNFLFFRCSVGVQTQEIGQHCPGGSQRVSTNSCLWSYS